MEKQKNNANNSNFGKFGYFMIIFLFFLYLGSINLYGLKFATGAVISWVTGVAICCLRILFQDGNNPARVNKPFGWLLFLMFPLFIPLALPLWIIPFILIITYFIAIASFGGHGKHIFNPVIVATVFMLYGYGDMGLTDASCPFPQFVNGYNVWTAGIPPKADIRDVFSSIPAEKVLVESLVGNVPSIPGSCYGSIIFIASFLFALFFQRKILWWIISVLSFLIFAYFIPQPSFYNIPSLNVLFLGIIPSLLLCGVADSMTLPERLLGQSINAILFSGFSVLILFYSPDILAPAYGFLLAQVVSPLIIDIVEYKNE